MNWKLIKSTSEEEGFFIVNKFFYELRFLFWTFNKVETSAYLSDEYWEWYYGYWYGLKLKV